MTTDPATAPDDVPASAAQPWHLAASDAERVVADFEHALICLCEAFGRYNMLGLAGVSDEASFSGQDNMVLHIIQTLDRPKCSGLISADTSIGGSFTHRGEIDEQKAQIVRHGVQAPGREDDQGSGPECRAGVS